MTLGLSQISVLIFIFILALFLAISIRINIKLGITVLKIEDSIEECLDLLDKRYESISKILEIPIFFDSVEVRQVVSDIDGAREEVLRVANTLAGISQQEYKED